MPIRSMTGFAQVKGQFNGQSAFTLSLKSVNHRFLDLHFRMPSDSDALEMKLRRLLKEKIARGHIELTLSLERAESEGFQLNHKLVGAYIHAFRAASASFGIAAEPDLNAILRLPGALDAPQPAGNENLEEAVLASVNEALSRLNQMREEEGRGMEKELRERMRRLKEASQGVDKFRQAILRAY